MPYIEASKFSEVIKTMDFVELKLYMKNLLQALAHIHSLGIIHRYAACILLCQNLLLVCFSFNLLKHSNICDCGLSLVFISGDFTDNVIFYVRNKTLWLWKTIHFFNVSIICDVI